MTLRKKQTAVAGLLDDIKKSGINPASTSETEETNNEKNKTPITNSEEKPFYHLSYIDPSMCTPWFLANRLQIDTNTCADLIASIEKNGQRIPAIVRKKTDNNYELICGARRLFACQHLQIKLLVAIVDITDQDAALLMDLENREREDISAYERGLDFANWIKNGIYKNATEICEKTGIKKSLLSQLLNIANLDTNIIQAFNQPSDIPLRWARELYRICKVSETNHSLMVKTAAALNKESLSPQEIYNVLIKATNSNQKGSKRTPESKTIKFAKIQHYGNNKLKIQFEKELTNEGYKELMNLLEKFTAVNNYVK